MDENGSNGLHYSGIIVALLLFTAWAFQQERLSGTRPDILPAPLHPNTTFQDVPVRLWEDPLEAVARYRNRLDAQKEKHKFAVTKDDLDQGHKTERVHKLLSWLLEKRGLQDLIVIPVMLPGDSYAENRENRLRRRHGVLAGLARQGLYPLDGTRIGYWFREDEWDDFYPDPAKTASHMVIPYEVFFGNWSNVQTLPGVSDSSDYAEGGLGVLVLWLDSTRFDKNPLMRLGVILNDFISKNDGRLRAHVRIVGPYSSDGLARMVRELEEIEDGREISNGHKGIIDLLKQQKGIAMISPSASAPAASLLREDTGRFGAGCRGDAETKLANLFREQLGITFIRTLSTDKCLVGRLVEELALRNISPHCTPKTKSAADFLSPCLNEGDGAPYFGHRHHVVLISEWDTRYGRTLPTLFAEEVRERLCRDEAGTGERYRKFCRSGTAGREPLRWIHRYGYLRGIDGAIPETGEQAGQSAKPEAGNQVSVLDQTEYLEPAIGHSQFDYLRRLALHIQEMDRALRDQDQGGIRAFGILGNDFFDKLLILQALREYFPNHVYFTTDLDAGYLDPTHYPWTHNLIAASSFGLTLHEDWHNMVPPARDSYQTAVFLGTMLALDPQITEEGKREGIHARLQARIFEVGKDRFFDLKPGSRGRPGTTEREPPAPGMEGAAGGGFYPDYFDVGLSRRTLHYGGILALLVVLFLLLSAEPLRRLPIVVWDWVEGLSDPLYGLFFLFLITCAPLLAYGIWTWIGWTLAGVEPLAFASGVSGWPSQSVWLVAGGIAWVLVVKSYIAVVKSDERIRKKFKLAPDSGSSGSDGVGNPISGRKPGGRTAPGAWLKSFLDWYLPGLDYKGAPYSESEKMARYSRLSLQPGPDEYYDAADFWRNYRVHAAGLQRTGRVALMLLLFYSATWIVLIDIAEPISPLRGAVAQLSSWVIGMCWLAPPFLFLLFGVLDEMLLCDRLVNKLAEPNVGWPGVREEYLARMPNMSVRMAYQWASIQFIAERTKASSRLVYGPFIVLLFVMLSLSSLFDNWDTSGGVTAIIALCTVIGFFSAVLVRRAAHKARRKVLGELREMASKGEYEKSKTVAEGAQVLIDEINGYQEGAFRKWYNEPAVRAMVWVLTIAGAIMTEHMRFGI